METVAEVEEKNGVTLLEIVSASARCYVVRSIHTAVERHFDDLARARAELESWVANGGLPKD